MRSLMLSFLVLASAQVSIQIGSASVTGGTGSITGTPLVARSAAFHYPGLHGIADDRISSIVETAVITPTPDNLLGTSRSQTHNVGKRRRSAGDEVRRKRRGVQDPVATHTKYDDEDGTIISSLEPEYEDVRTIPEFGYVTTTSYVNAPNPSFAGPAPTRATLAPRPGINPFLQPVQPVGPPPIQPAAPPPRPRPDTLSPGLPIPTIATLGPRPWSGSYPPRVETSPRYGPPSYGLPVPSYATVPNYATVGPEFSADLPAPTVISTSRTKSPAPIKPTYVPASSGSISPFRGTTVEMTRTTLVETKISTSSYDPPAITVSNPPNLSSYIPQLFSALTSPIAITTIPPNFETLMESETSSKLRITNTTIDASLPLNQPTLVPLNNPITDPVYPAPNLPTPISEDANLLSPSKGTVSNQSTVPIAETWKTLHSNLPKLSATSLNPKFALPTRKPTSMPLEAKLSPKPALIPLDSAVTETSRTQPGPSPQTGTSGYTPQVVLPSSRQTSSLPSTPLYGNTGTIPLYTVKPGKTDLSLRPFPTSRITPATPITLATQTTLASPRTIASPITRPSPITIASPKVTNSANLDSTFSAVYVTVTVTTSTFLSPSRGPSNSAALSTSSINDCSRAWNGIPRPFGCTLVETGTPTRKSTREPGRQTSATKSTATGVVAITPTAPVPPPSGNWWHPRLGAKWQIILDRDGKTRGQQIRLLPEDAEIFDLDLFDTPVETFNSIHDEGKFVICYFSAGGSESWRTDYALIKSKDKGERMKKWPNERWLNIRSPDVWDVMKKRLDLAYEKGCDGIDADNTDVFNDDSGRGGGFKPALNQNDTITFVKRLAGEAHARGMALGIKNAEDIFPGVVNEIDFAVNEECAAYGCSPYEMFVNSGRPVFHIEYAIPKIKGNQIELKSAYKGWNRFTSQEVQSLLCLETAYKNPDPDYPAMSSVAAAKMSTVIKTLDLTTFVMYCDRTFVSGTQKR